MTSGSPPRLRPAFGDISVSYERRRASLAPALASVDAEALLISSRINVRYLTGFAGSAGSALIGRDGAVTLAVDPRYVDQAAVQASGVPVVVTRSYAEELLAGAARRGCRRVAVEAHVLTVETHDAVRASVPEVELVPLSRAVEGLRAVKDAAEVNFIRHACRITEAALAKVTSSSLRGRTEREIARELERRMVDAGADGPSFETIVAAGPATALPHHAPSDRPLQTGDLVLMDFGASVQGYAADLTRTFVIGDPDAAPATWQTDLHRLVLTAQDVARTAMVPGVASDEVARRVQDVFAVAGLADSTLDGIGHCLGLEIHEPPILGYGEVAPLQAGMVLAIEPGVYLPGRGGVRIEDVVRVRPQAEAGRPPDVATSGQNERPGSPAAAGSGDDSGPEALTTSSRDLLVLP